MLYCDQEEKDKRQKSPPKPDNTLDVERKENLVHFLKEKRPDCEGCSDGLINCLEERCQEEDWLDEENENVQIPRNQSPLLN